LTTLSSIIPNKTQLFDLFQLINVMQYSRKLKLMNNNLIINKKNLSDFLEQLNDNILLGFFIQYKK